MTDDTPTWKLHLDLAGSLVRRAQAAVRKGRLQSAADDLTDAADNLIRAERKFWPESPGARTSDTLGNWPEGPTRPDPGKPTR